MRSVLTSKTHRMHVVLSTTAAVSSALEVFNLSGSCVDNRQPHDYGVGLLVQWSSTPSQLSDGTSVVVVLTASGNDALRTKPLDRTSATSWFMEGEHIQVFV